MKGRYPAVTIGVLGVIALIVAIAGCGRNGNAQQQAVDTTVAAVEAMVVSRAILIPWIEVTGQVSGINEAAVISETEGIIRSVSFELGDTVRRGSVLVSVDGTIARLAMEQARQDLQTATMNLEAARRLYADSAASRSELVNARSAYNGARAAYEAALKRFQDTEIRAPISGEIASREDGIAVGNLLQPTMPVARIIDLSRLRLDSWVGPEDVGSIAAGARAEILVSMAGADTMRGMVDAVAAGADPATGSFAVVVTWNNSGEGTIRSGMAATARIRTVETDSVLVVPAAALSVREDTTMILTARNGRVIVKPVQTGASANNRTQIVAGLDAGDTVLTTRTATLAQGDSVEVHLVGLTGERP